MLFHLDLDFYSLTWHFYTSIAHVRSNCTKSMLVVLEKGWMGNRRLFELLPRDIKLAQKSYFFMCPQLNPATWRINRLNVALAAEYGVAEAEIGRAHV